MILVCYLQAPGEEYAAKARRFIESYERHPAGVEHDQLMVVKDGATPALAWPQIGHPNDGLDVGSLLRVARDWREYDLLMWLGSHSRILADGWLAKFHAAISLPDVGAVAATASFEAGYSWESPNPHLRTGALMIQPELLCSLGFGDPADRLGCCEFEHGRGSLYRRLRDRGLEGVVVGWSGVVYHESSWALSETYRRFDQGELVVADKQTDAYASAPLEERRALALMAGWEAGC